MALTFSIRHHENLPKGWHESAPSEKYNNDTRKACNHLEEPSKVSQGSACREFIERSKEADWLSSIRLEKQPTQTTLAL